MRRCGAVVAFLVPFGTAIGVSSLGYNLRHLPLKYRWCLAMGCAKLGQHISQRYGVSVLKQWLPKYFTNPHVSAWWLFIQIIHGLWLANAHAGFFGGNQYYAVHGIDSHDKAVLNALCCGQVYFRPKSKTQKRRNGISQRYRSFTELMKMCALFGTGYMISKLLQQYPLIKTWIESNRLLNVEMLNVMYCLIIYVANAPSCVYGLLFGGDHEGYDLEVVKPYDFAYFLGSIREFWKHWSRPMGEALRYAAYEPLGGRNNTIVSVAALFATNATFHFDLTHSVHGYRAYADWSKAFALMAMSLTTQMVVENHMFRKYYKQYTNINSGDAEDANDHKKAAVYAKEALENNKLWQVFCFGLFRVTMSATVDIAYRKAMGADLSILCNTFLLQPAFLN